MASGKLSQNAEEVWRYICRNGWLDLDEDPPRYLLLSYKNMNAGAFELVKAGLADHLDGCASVRLVAIWAPGIIRRPRYMLC